MSNCVVLGPFPLEQPLTYRVDRTNGFTYTRTWIGPRLSIERIRLVEQRFAESMEVTAQGAIYTLVARYAQSVPGQAEIPTETQDLDAEIVQQNVLLHPYFQPLTPSDQNAVRSAFQSGMKRSDVITTFTSGGGPVDAISSPGNLTLATQAYDLMINGTESYENHIFVLNRTRTASRRYAGKLNLSNIGKVCTTANLVKYTGNGLLFDTPDLSVTSDEAAKSMIAGWRLRICRCVDKSNGSREMTEQWVLAKHSSLLYATYVP